MSIFSPRKPVPDPARSDAFTPSPLSLALLKQKHPRLDANYDDPYRGGRWRVLVLGTDQRYLPTRNGSFFSTGNHPVETLVPLIHLERAGFAFDVATISGKAVKFEEWAMPQEDEEVVDFRRRHQADFDRPARLGDVLDAHKGPDSPYLALFIPGGHGALLGLPHDPDVRRALEWALQEDRFVVSLCHGPAAFLSLGDENPLKGRKICAFPDLMDKTVPALGYLPGRLTWFFGRELERRGINVTNTLATGSTLKDGRLLTGDSPFAANALGKLAVTELLAAIAAGQVAG